MRMSTMAAVEHGTGDRMVAVLVVCNEVLEGLRASEATVAIRSTTGKTEYLRTGRDLLYQQGGKQYLEIGLVHEDPKTQACLIEFPHEADSGANRAWVARSDLLVLNNGQKASA